MPGSWVFLRKRSGNLVTETRRTGLGPDRGRHGQRGAAVVRRGLGAARGQWRLSISLVSAHFGFVSARLAD